MSTKLPHLPAVHGTDSHNPDLCVFYVCPSCQGNQQHPALWLESEASHESTYTGLTRCEPSSPREQFFFPSLILGGHVGFTYSFGCMHRYAYAHKYIACICVTVNLLYIMHADAPSQMKKKTLPLIIV